MKEPFILLTNDDGINAQGISALAREIRKIGGYHCGPRFGTERCRARDYPH